MPAITSAVPIASGRVIGSPTRTTDEAMPSSGVPSMPSEPVTGGRARATETAAQVAGRAGEGADIDQRDPEIGLAEIEMAARARRASARIQSSTVATDHLPGQRVERRAGASGGGGHAGWRAPR